METNIAGTIFDQRFRLLEILSAGAFGVVYKAEQMELNRIVALKVLKGSPLNVADAKVRFEREAKLLATLRHENIVSVFGFGIADGVPYLSLEYLQGRTLDQVIADEAGLEWHRAVTVAMQICSALKEAHAKGIVHRDISPRNIMLASEGGQETAKVLDFGLSTLSAQSELTVQRLTQTGQVIGTVSYMSPEAATGSKSDERSDIYSLGCVLYECLTGQSGFDGVDVLQIMQKQALDLPARFVKFPKLKQVPAELELVVFKALAKNPEKRYQSADAFKEALTLVLAGRLSEVDVSGVRTSINEAARQPVHKRWLLVGILFLIVLAGGIVAYVNNSNIGGAGEKSGQAPVAVSPQEINRQSDVRRSLEILDEARAAKQKGDLDQMDTLARRALLTVGKDYDEKLQGPAQVRDDTELLDQLSALYDQGWLAQKHSFPPLPHAEQVFLGTIWARDLHFESIMQQHRMLTSAAIMQAVYGDYAGAAAAFYFDLDGLTGSTDVSPAQRHQVFDQETAILPSNKRKTGVPAYYYDLSRARILDSDGDRKRAIAYENSAARFLEESHLPRSSIYIQTLLPLYSLQWKLGDNVAAKRTGKQAEQIILSLDRTAGIRYRDRPESEGPLLGQTSTRDETLNLLANLFARTPDPTLRKRLSADVAELSARTAH